MNQTFQDFELLIVDDGSTDETQAIVGSIVDPRVRLLCLNRNRGQSFATNHGARKARGEWLMLADSDDRSLPDRLEKQLRAVDRDSDSSGRLNGVFGRAAFVDTTNTVTRYFPPIERSIAGDLSLVDALTGSTFGSGRMLVKRNAFIAVKGFDIAIRKSLDRDFIIRLLQQSRIVGIDDVVVECLDTSDGLTSTPDPASLRRTLEKNAHEYRRVGRRNLSYQYRRVGEEYLLLGEEREAAQMFLRSLKLHPNAEHRRLYTLATRSRWFGPYGSLAYAHYLKLKLRLQNMGPRREHDNRI
ncbi:glycosyl transferase family 2 protein [Salinisphaera sp. T31B1]